MAPLDVATSMGLLVQNILYVVTGIFFGFALEQAGFGNSRNLAAQFYLRDMRVLKVMFTAIITAMVLIFWSSALGLMDFPKIYVNETYLWSGILGGFIFGVGFVIGGYCPGTALVSMATLKLDGLFFVVGLGIGIFIFGETFTSFRIFWEMAGDYGRVTLFEWMRVNAGYVVFGAVLMALGMFAGAEWLEKFFARRDAAKQGGAA